MTELFLAIEIGGKRAAIPASQVQSLIVLESVTPVPQAPGHIAGLTSVRSRVLTVVDPTGLLGMQREDSSPPPAEEHAVIMEFGGHAYAMKVDSILDVTSSLGEPGKAPDDLGKGWASAAAGVIETGLGPLVILDAERLVTCEDLPVAA